MLEKFGLENEKLLVNGVWHHSYENPLNKTKSCYPIPKPYTPNPSIKKALQWDWKAVQ